MKNEEYLKFKERAKEAIRDMLADAMQEIEDWAWAELESRNMVVADNDDDYQNVDQWTGFIIKEIVNEWNDPDIDPFAAK